MRHSLYSFLFLFAAAMAAPVSVLAQEAPQMAPPSLQVDMAPLAEPKTETKTELSADPVMAETGTSDAQPAPVEAPAAQTEVAAPVAGTVAMGAAQSAMKFLRDGGPSIWAIAALSVLTLALILWKLWRYLILGAWGHGRAYKAVAAFERGDVENAQQIVRGRRGLRSRMVAVAIAARLGRSDVAAREETARVAKQRLAEAASGLRALELIATIAPLLGLLGTVMGMIAAFQALQEAGSRADPSMLAGGIWEALLTTAAGMAVAIPASAALTWFEAIVDRLRRDSEDMCARIFVTPLPAPAADVDVVKPIASTKGDMSLAAE